MRFAPSRAVLGALLAAVVLVASACAGGAPGGSAQNAGYRRLSDVTPLADPKSYVGPSTAIMGTASVDPITTTPKPTLPVTVTDVQGTAVTVDDVSRILALDVYGTLSRTVFELGLGDKVVGRDTSSAFPEIADRPLVTPSGHDLNAEKILELAPTLIITDTSLGPWDVVLQVRDAGVPVVVVDSKRSLTSTSTLTEQVAAAVGLPEEGTRLAARTQQAVSATTAQIAKIAPSDKPKKLRVLFLYVRGQSGVYYLFGKGSGTDSLITALGAVDVATEKGITGMRPMTDEAVVDAAPDVVLVMTKGLESVGGVDGLITHVPALAQTPAGEHRRIVDMDDTEILSFGPQTAGVLEALAVALYAPRAGA
jgi:iron complex transport system substrate-binding protein